jgi:hypothetical protein
MASLNEIGMGIGDFALNLLEREKANPQPVSRKAPVRGNVPDIENVQVLQEDVDAVLSNSFGVRRDTPPKVNLQEERRKQLKEQIQVKVNELKALLNELHYGPGTTTTGSIGAPNFAGGKTYEPSKRNKKSKRRRASVRRKKV